MASSLLEQARGSHEEVERLERLIVKALKNEARTHKEKLSQNHKVRKILDVMQDKSAKLAKIYHDDDNARKEEINSMAGENVFSIFYDKLKETREYHKRYPSYDITEAENDEELLSLYNTHVEFSGEEASGRCLDLHHLHQIYLNSKFGKKIDYITYINNLSNFSEIPRQLRLSRPYRDYLGALLAYLGDFYNRTQPLGGKDRELKKFDQEFDEKFDKGEIAGWEDRGEGKISGGDASSQIDLEAFESAEELATLGPDRLKDALQSLGLKAGGTLEQRAERLMMTKGKPLESLDRKLFAKGSAPAVSPLLKAHPGDKRLEAEQRHQFGVLVSFLPLAAIRSLAGGACGAAAVGWLQESQLGRRNSPSCAFFGDGALLRNSHGSGRKVLRKGSLLKAHRAALAPRVVFFVRGSLLRRVGDATPERLLWCCRPPSRSRSARSSARRRGSRLGSRAACCSWCRCSARSSTTQLPTSRRSRRGRTTSSRWSWRRRRRRNSMKTATRRTSTSTTPSSCRWAGTASRSPTGCTSSMASTRSSSARSAATRPTGAAAPLSGTSRSGGTSTGCGRSASPTTRTSTR
mmetsp:Transcript_43189/g.102494  ORF Transcript_43189/g.102494 Transcript_43189/m.102494 type:complete len:578 (+) Transcript_43189:89-1822(+)